MNKKKCFVVTAIGSSGTPTRQHADNVLTYLILPVCEKLDLDVVRVDQETSTGNINNSIINHLKNDEIVIVDMTGHNPNVFFELGYRQALNLPLIPIIQKDQELPFDVITERTLFYSLLVQEIDEHRSSLEKMIENYKDFRVNKTKKEQYFSNEDIFKKLENIEKLITQASNNNGIDKFRHNSELNKLMINTNDSLSQSNLLKDLKDKKFSIEVPRTDQKSNPDNS